MKLCVLEFCAPSGRPLNAATVLIDSEMLFRSQICIRCDTQGRRPVAELAHPRASECEGGRVGSGDKMTMSPSGAILTWKAK